MEDCRARVGRTRSGPAILTMAMELGDRLSRGREGHITARAGCVYENAHSLSVC